MTSIEQIVIVGGGVAGARAAEFLRTSGYEGAITLLGDEPERPYSRPPLSKGYLRGERPRDGLYVHPEAFYDEHRIDFRPSTRVAAIEPGSRAVELASGERLTADRILLATGASPRLLSVPGADLPGVHLLRTLADADALRDQVANVERVVVVGAGWIGSEVAASLRKLGRHVTLVASGSTPLESVVGPEIGAVYASLHREHGVELLVKSAVTRILGGSRAEGVELASGQRVAADLVVVGVGVEPRTDLARAAGLTVSNGIEVSETLESSVPGIFAAGDVAAAWNPFYEQRIRTEHVSNARVQGAAVAPLLLGQGEPFDRIPSFYSDQYDASLEYTGLGRPSDPMVVRGSLEDRSFVAFLLADWRVVAGISVGVKDAGKPIEKLIRSRAIVEARRLKDLSVPLDALAEPARPQPLV